MRGAGRRSLPWAALVASVLGLARMARADGLDPAKALTQFGLDSWTTDQGLPNATVNAVLQTREGYVWLATYDGLARFDGSRFTVFNQRDGLGNNGIRSLCEDRTGSLWVGTNGGGVSRLTRGQFTRFTTTDGLPSNIVWSLRPDIRDGSLWIGTNGGGLARYRGGKIERFDPEKSGRSIYSIAQARDGTLWLGTQVDGLRRLDPDGRWTTYSTADGLPKGLVTSVTLSPDGTLWGGTSGGLFRIRDGQVLPLPIGLEALASLNVTSIVEDAAGTLWIGTNGSGVARYATGKVSFLTSKDGAGDVIFSLHLDYDGSIWIGTNGGGVFRLRDGSFTAFTTREGLSRNFTYTAYEDRTGALWAGTASGLDRLQGGTFVPEALPLERPAGIRSIAEGPDGSLWVGTYGAGLFRRHAGRWRSYTTRDGLVSDNVRALLADRSGRIWVATSGGLSVLEGEAWRNLLRKDGLPSDSLIGIAEGTDGSIWIGTDGNGVARFQGGRFEVLTSREGLASDVVLAIFAEASGIVWVGTNGGVTRWKDGRFASFTSAAGLPSDAVTQIVDDSEGNLWMGTGKGVSRVAKTAFTDVEEGRSEKLSVDTFDVLDGMKSSQCTAPGQPAGLRTRDGRLWFATTRGVATVDPTSLRLNSRLPNVVVEEVFVDGQQMPAGARIEAPAGSARIEFRYAALSPVGPGRTSVRFRLVGFDGDWIDAGDRKRADYTGLPPGSYTFKIAARTSRSEWVEARTEILLTVLPHFYQTWAFALGSLLFLAGLGTAGYQLRVRALKARGRDLTRLVEERTHSLAEQKERAEKAQAQAERLLTERERVEVELRRQGARYRDLFEQSLGLLCTHDLSGKLLSVNPATAESLGYQVGDLVGHLLEEFIPADLRPSFSRYLEIMQRERSASGNLVLIDRQGDRRTWRYRNVLRDDGGGSPFVIAFAQDITDEEIVQVALRESESRFRQFAENIDATVFIRSTISPRLFYLSPAYQVIWGRQPTTDVDEFLETVHPDDRQILFSADARIEEGYDIEYRIIRPDGTVRWIRCRTFPIPEEDGRILRVAGIAEDVTARKSVELMRENLAHTIVHDLRNPLTSILASMEMLEAALDGPGAEAKIEMVRLARRGAVRLRGLVDAILDVSRLEQGAMTFDRTRIDLRSAVADAFEMQRPLAKPQSLRLVNDVQKDCPSIWADRELLSRILQNLVGNAIKFTPAGGEIRVQTHASPDPEEMVEIQVSDSGPGIPAEVRDRLFEKFVTGRQKGHGSGLGLLFCRLAVEAQGGTIRAHNRPEGGATFTFTLPKVRKDQLS